ncbi:winged helix-turn-helix domain-containing protein [Pluralibacter sp.]|uniref:winged helix-turn-helix domain-containing protein n=1 Tax=Pluralibacter sp. TaxID=1920032 RepID=UPI0025FE5834|nr:winged helix-turn-helix domain-containing protein [Pluralibacter sp.]MBV8044708.1 winged helix-turn-helix domain-containing protein [Pluralibacter sp.]
MSSQILINNIIFDPENNSLVVVSENNRVVKMNQPVSRCLLLLINRFPDAVPQADFFQFVWGNEGEKIPTNALYQNISLLRRALKSASLDLAEVVVTVPRFGFRLSAALTVKAANGINVSMATPEQGIALKPAEELMTPSADVGAQQRADNVLKSFTDYAFSFRVAAYAVFFTLICISIFLVTRNEDNDIIFDSYTMATTHNGCNVYTYPDFAQNNASEMNDYFSAFNITCTTLKQAYLSVNTARTRVSVAYCDKDISEAKTCITHIYWNDN